MWIGHRSQKIAHKTFNGLELSLTFTEPGIVEISHIDLCTFYTFLLYIFIIQAPVDHDQRVDNSIRRIKCTPNDIFYLLDSDLSAG